MIMWSIDHNRARCIGCGACVAVCPDNWEMSDDGKANPININLDKIGYNKNAAEVCPVKCIKIRKQG